MKVFIFTDDEDFRLTLANLGADWSDYAGGCRYMVKLTLLTQGATIVPPTGMV